MVDSLCGRYYYIISVTLLTLTARFVAFVRLASSNQTEFYALTFDKKRKDYFYYRYPKEGLEGEGRESCT